MNSYDDETITISSEFKVEDFIIDAKENNYGPTIITSNESENNKKNKIDWTPCNLSPRDILKKIIAVVGTVEMLLLEIVTNIEGNALHQYISFWVICATFIGFDINIFKQTKQEEKQEKFEVSLHDNKNLLNNKTEKNNDKELVNINNIDNYSLKDLKELKGDLEKIANKEDVSLNEKEPTQKKLVKKYN